jgi:hypothetical protein
MENLFVLLDKMQQFSLLPVCAQDTIIVQNIATELTRLSIEASFLIKPLNLC